MSQCLYCAGPRTYQSAKGVPEVCRFHRSHDGKTWYSRSRWCEDCQIGSKGVKTFAHPDDPKKARYCAVCVRKYLPQGTKAVNVPFEKLKKMKKGRASSSTARGGARTVPPITTQGGGAATVPPSHVQIAQSLMSLFSHGS